MEFDTELPLDVCESFGLPQMHGAFFQHRLDLADKNNNVVVVDLQEVSRAVFFTAMTDARKNHSRVFIYSENKSQLQEAAEQAAQQLPAHKRLSAIRAASGGWGRIQ
jgi:hypothetical protein